MDNERRNGAGRKAGSIIMSLKNKYWLFEQSLLKLCHSIPDGKEKKVMLRNLSKLEAACIEADGEIKEHRNYDAECFQ